MFGVNKPFQSFQTKFCALEHEEKIEQKYTKRAMSRAEDLSLQNKVRGYSLI